MCGILIISVWYKSMFALNQWCLIENAGYLGTIYGQFLESIKVL